MFRMLTAAALMAGTALPAAGQSVCGEREKFIEYLSTSYLEAPVAFGLASNGSILEVLASVNGSWTVIITRPDGISCVIASGEAWQAAPTLAMGPHA